jgi:hypothetical protein
VRDLAVLVLHLLETVARLAGPGGRAFRGRRIRARQAPTPDPQSVPEAFTNLRISDRLVAGLCALLIRPGRLIRSAIVFNPQRS